MHISRTASRPADKYSRGLNISGCSYNVRLIVAVVARRKSLSIFILQMCVLVAAWCNWSRDMPIAFSILPPNLLIVSTKSNGTDDAPCKTNGVDGISFCICSNMSKRNFSSADFRLYAPWDVPIATAKESVWVSITNCFAIFGSVYVDSSECVFSSSIPANTPSSDSTVAPRACAYRTTFAVAVAFSSISRLLKSSITLENPMFNACIHDSTDDPWSRCNVICSFCWILRPAIIPISISSPIYFNADSEIATMTGLWLRRAADTIAWIVSILYALNAGTAK